MSEALSNLRDIGGPQGADGRRVRRGLVFRSDAPRRLLAADHARVAALGLRTVVDLRGVEERGRAPGELGVAGRRVVELPIEPLVADALREIARDHPPTSADVMGVLHGAYEAYVVRRTPVYRAVFALLLEEGGLPLLLHCSAGKDRTGFACALILTSLGVGHEAVVADYLASNRLWRGDSALAAGLPEASARTLVSVHEALLATAFAAIARDYGGFDAYAARGLGLDAAARERLRALLLE